jgi:DNA polymerase I-like protein with 3'-5' exonuclease and polymerase domains
MVYGQFHLLRGDEGGTRSGRFSSSTPNLQNLPSRDDELAPLVRGLFIPDDGHKQWRKYDYSQIEYRFLIHFAVNGLHDDSADEVRRIFNANPQTDYHDMTRDLVHRQTGQLLDRKPIKNINFGLIYGMGVDKLAGGLGLSVKEGKELFAAYHKGAPFAKATMDACSKEAMDFGTITTILGRKSRFDLWEPDSWGHDRENLALPYEQAILRYGKIRRAYTHKALNRRLQGSAADLMKVAMLQCWEEGIFDETGVPRLTVHDELDFSDPGGKDEAFRAMRHVLETAIPLRIPVKADCDIGPNWGNVKEVEE